MRATDIIREAMRVREVSQTTLADKIEGWSQSNVTGVLNNSGGNMKITTMYRILNALGFEIVVRSRTGSGEGWVVDYTEEDIKQMTAKSKQIIEKRKEYKPKK